LLNYHRWLLNHQLIFNQWFAEASNRQVADWMGPYTKQQEGGCDESSSDWSIASLMQLRMMLQFLYNFGCPVEATLLSGMSLGAFG
jgi:hypothetical protein